MPLHDFVKKLLIIKLSWLTLYNKNVYKEKCFIEIMDTKKRTAVLVAVALVLACTAIIMNVVSSSEVPTEASDLKINAGAGEVGVTVIAPEVEDKGIEVDLE
jgi:TRAP-type uncharacterized transport system fused permease subunit